MQLVTYESNGKPQLAFLFEGFLFETNKVNTALPSQMHELLANWQYLFPLAQKSYQSLPKVKADDGLRFAEAKILAPLPKPVSFRDAYAFRQHVETSRRNRGLEMIPEFDQFPVFYFSNPNSITGPGDIYCMPEHLKKLDFELEVAVLICKKGRNIPAAGADEYIGALMILNDFSARELQMQEMKLNLGPAKGKDFATATGPVLVTTDELAKRECAPQKGHTGKAWDLEMTCRVNGKQVSAGNLRDMEFTFAEIIERASYGVDLYPGDIIGSGTVGTGCFLELNGTGRLQSPEYQEQWLREGDVIELEVEKLGVLRNTIRKEEGRMNSKT